MIQIKNKVDCCGCTACANICPKQAITMKPDPEGFLYPVVNEENCINLESVMRPVLFIIRLIEQKKKQKDLF